MIEVGGKLVEKFAENLAIQLTSDGAAVAADSPGTTATASANGGGAETTAAESDAGAAESPASIAGSSANGSAAAAASTGATESTGGSAAVQVPAQEDSLNLVRLVGPAILKRVLPVAAIAAGVALLGRRIMRGLRQRKQ